ncbi:MAG: DNA polymerase III subunit delta [Bacillota bacterium]|nr:DNA polymerase III subunit delta [Bacillota bacterium]
MLSYQAVCKKLSESDFAHVYLFFGDEKYLQEELVERIVQAYLGHDSEFGLEKIDGTLLSFEEILERLNEEGLFSTRRLLVVNNHPSFNMPRKTEEVDLSHDKNNDGFQEKEAAELLDKFFTDHEGGKPVSILVLLAPRVDRRKKLFKMIDKRGVVVECSLLKGEALADWIRQKSGRLGKKIEREALERLMLAGDHNLHYLAAELEKYNTYIGDKENVISSNVVDQLFSGDLQGDVFKLADALAERNLFKADKLLQILVSRREKPLLIFFMLARHYRLLLHARCLMDEGLPPAQFASTLEVQPFVARKLREQAVLYKRESLEEALITLQKTDRQIKTGRLEPEQALFLLLNRIDCLQTSDKKSTI